MIHLPVMHLELEPDEMGQDRRGARLCFYRGGPLAWFGADDGEAVGEEGEYWGVGVVVEGLPMGRVVGGCDWGG